MAEETPNQSESQAPPPAAPAPAPEAAAPAAAEGQAPAAARGGEQREHREQRGRGGQGGQRGGGGRPGGQRGPRRSNDRQADESGVESAVVRIYRCSKVVKGGRTFSFGALVVAGDRRGNVGIGYGKANEVPPAVEKATKDARKAMIKVNLKGSTIPHTVKGTSGASTVVLVPARPGTGVTAGRSVRNRLDFARTTDALTRTYSCTSLKNLVKATI